MATIHFAKIGPRGTVTAGATATFKWNNPPWGTVLSYWAVPIPKAAKDPNPNSIGQVEVTGVCVTHHANWKTGDKQYVEIKVHNPGSSDTRFDMYQSWID